MVGAGGMRLLGAGEDLEDGGLKRARVDSECRARPPHANTLWEVHVSTWLLGDPATCKAVLWAARRLAITPGSALMRMTSSGGLRAVASACLTHMLERRLPGINLGDTMPPPASPTSRAQRPPAKAQTAPSDRPLSSPLAFSTTTA